MTTAVRRNPPLTLGFGRAMRIFTRNVDLL